MSKITSSVHGESAWAALVEQTYVPGSGVEISCSRSIEPRMGWGVGGNPMALQYQPVVMMFM